MIKIKKATGADAIIAELRASVGAGAPIDPRVKLKRLTAEVAVLMALLHGGDWLAEVDHDRQFVMVARR